MLLYGNGRLCMTCVASEADLCVSSWLWQNCIEVSSRLFYQICTQEYAHHSNSAAALQTLLQLQDANPNITIGYFYFDFNDTEKQRLDRMIRSILFQVSQRTSDGQQALSHFYERHENGQRQPPQDSVQELLCKTLGVTDSTYIILDALDECTERDDLLSFLKSLVQQQLAGLRILATSRREWDIEEPLRSVSDFNINIQSAIVDDDIRTYIDARLITDPKLSKWPENVRTEILEQLMEKADGM